LQAVDEKVDPNLVHPALKGKGQETGKKASGIAEILQKSGYVAVPISRICSVYISAEASVGDQKLRLIVDTGSPCTFLDLTRTKHLHLKGTQRGELGPSPGVDAPWEVCRIQFLHVGQFKTGPIQLRSRDLSALNASIAKNQGQLVDGLLGDDVLTTNSAVIDYSVDRLYLQRRNDLGDGHPD
jgi:hypothetical protein